MMNFSYGAAISWYEKVMQKNADNACREAASAVNESKRETALKMLADGMPEDKVAKYSGLSKEEVKKLK